MIAEKQALRTRFSPHRTPDGQVITAGHSPTRADSRLDGEDIITLLCTARSITCRQRGGGGLEKVTLPTQTPHELPLQRQHPTARHAARGGGEVHGTRVQSGRRYLAWMRNLGQATDMARRAFNWPLSSNKHRDGWWTSGW